MEGRGPDEVRSKIRTIRAGLANGDFNPAEFLGDGSPGEIVTAEQLYLNEKVLDLFNRAEVERRDYRRGDNPPNVFFGKIKSWKLPWSAPETPDSFQIRTLNLNAIVLLAFASLGLVALHISLKRQMRKV